MSKKISRKIAEVNEMEGEEQEKLKKILKEKINYKVKLILHGELRCEELGNMNALVEPRLTDEEHLITFLGVYGIGGQPLYIHGTDLKASKDELYRNSLNIAINEDTGNPTSESDITLLKLDDIDIKGWFSSGVLLSDELALDEKLRIAEPNEKYLAEKILKGKLCYLPGTYSASYSIFDEPEFIDRVLKYFERIV